MKFKVLFVTMLGVAGLGSSLALADGGGQKGAQPGTADGNCARVHLRGTVSGPQTFTVTVQRSSDQGSFATGKVVTVSLGSSGDVIGLTAGGCGTSSTLTVREADLRVLPPKPTSTPTGDASPAGTNGGPGGKDHGGSSAPGSGTPGSGAPGGGDGNGSGSGAPGGGNNPGDTPPTTSNPK